MLGHVIKGIAFSGFLILFSLYLAYRPANGLIDKYKARLGLVADIASLPRLVLPVAIFPLLIPPMALAYSRYQEHEADRFGLEITGDNQDAATAFIKLQVETLALPRPGWSCRLWRSSHPRIGERIDFCHEYKPRKTGQPAP